MRGMTYVDDWIDASYLMFNNLISAVLLQA